MSCTLTKAYQLRVIHQVPHGTESACKDEIHGHDFRLEVTITGELDTQAQWLVSRDELDLIVDEVIIQKFDKTNLNKHFKLTTGEALANSFYGLLKMTKIGPQLLSVAIQETSKNRFISSLD